VKFRAYKFVVDTSNLYTYYEYLRVREIVRKRSSFTLDRDAVIKTPNGGILNDIFVFSIKRGLTFIIQDPVSLSSLMLFTDGAARSTISGYVQAAPTIVVVKVYTADYKIGCLLEMARSRIEPRRPTLWNYLSSRTYRAFLDEASSMKQPTTELMAARV